MIITEQSLAKHSIDRSPFFVTTAFVRDKNCLTLIWVSSLGVCFEVGDNFTYVKFVIIMIETWNLVRKYTHISSFRKYTLQYLLRPPLILLMSALFCKKSAFSDKIVPLLKVIVWELCWKSFSSVFSFSKMKGYFYWK